MRAPLELAVVLLSGCAYFNGMYNANHWAAQAEHSERAGRVAEARERWRMADMHADSVLSRHPHSRWASDAMLVRGRALTHLELYNEAVGVLEQAVSRLPPGQQRATAQLYLGRANLALGLLPGAVAALDEAVRTGDPRVRSQALLYRGRANLALRRPSAALGDFRGSSEPEARFERARAALAGGQVEQAAAYLDSLAGAGSVQEALWLPLLDSLALAGQPDRASALVSRLASREDIARGARARLLLADGDRLHARRSDSAAAVRWRDVAESVPDSAEARSALVRLARLAIAGAASPDSLSPLAQRLEVLMGQGGDPGAQARDLLRLLELVDTLARMPGSQDAFWFLRAELLRDSLNAPAAAAVAFADMAERFPDSPWTPKALLAAIVAGHPAADSLQGVLSERYAASPYAAAAAGRPGFEERYATLEDSLRQALATVAGVAIEPVPGRRGVSGLEDEPGFVRPVPARPGARPGAPPTPAARPTVRPQPDP